MSEMVKRLRDRRQNVWEQAKDLADRAAEENRAFSSEEQGQWDAMNDELNKLDERIKAALDTEARAKEAEEAFNRLENKPQERKGPQEQEQESEFRAFARGEKGRVFEVKPDGPVNFRDLTKGTATAGGNTVPTSFYNRLAEHMIETSAILRAGAFVLNTGSGENLQVPKTTSHSSAAIVAEGASISESDPAFGQVTLGAFKYGTMIQVARELIDDTGVDLEGYLARQAGRALGNGFGAHAITGDTSGNNPKGVVTRATTGVTGGTGVTGAFTADNLIDLKFSVIEPYRMSTACVWLMRDATLASVRKLKDSNGQYLWQPSLVPGEPDTILGHRVVTDPNVAATATSAASVAFGDVSQYYVRLAGGIRFERSDDFAFSTDLVSFRALMRADGDLIDLTGAVKKFVGGAS